DGTPQSRKKCHGSRHQKGEKSSTQKSSVKIVFRRQLACKFPCSGHLSTHDDILLVAGNGGAACQQGGKWGKFF
ncbi:hypothetical protein, partial [Massilia genomosp. 1]|uniref:hypothetical protein n=1 Tax=Massilia genomosp. 1 TaxID=2609280 RepID=UPI001C9E88A8